MNKLEKKISNELGNLIQNNLFEIASDENLKKLIKIDQEAVNILYNNGFNDEVNNFKPVINDINYKFNFDNNSIKIAFRLNESRPWITVQNILTVVEVKNGL